MYNIKNFYLLDWLENTLNSNSIKNDYAPNGMQIEGDTNISKILFGVTLNEQLIKLAIKNKANAIITHHGLLNYKENIVVKGIKRNRLKLILKNNINIFSYHLPLDVHISLGNNYQLAKLLDLHPILCKNQLPLTYCNGLLWIGTSKKINNIKDLCILIEKKLNRKPLYIGPKNKIINKIAWCTGAGQKMFSDAIELGADVYITGEISESSVHLARENNVGFISAGHHATERYGVKALSQYIMEKLNIETQFVDIDNPI
ncbi:GTP cyclohydrolase 1 type 2 [Candidatus Kinetoplastibacterium sorsogonicusi]|uniref:GTP cyclohydrolase 1 type 2 n=1 Tax=Candidatus Kinetoplastidibacterium kentomonadis TaxID=1576550 RepID=A0A3Q8EQP4_9PROT|nr:Nif3-like dinuclear metal center hexameric protein [Candidatus Kinetoplastibacterium sorsogonicusi]AWD32161.1 GTP cyclohydrolase 1 type 2 [Candidatus Kinetoplastibacterium sorsogonicusi]